MKKYSRKTITLGTRVKRYRKLKKVTQEELAYTVGVSAAYIGFIEQGRRYPSLKTLDKIARALNVKLSDLLD